MINSFNAPGLFLNPLARSEKQNFFNVTRGY